MPQLQSKVVGVLSAIGAATVVFLALVAEPSAQSSVSQAKDQKRQEIERIIREYLLQNPEILIEMSQRLEEKQAELRQTQFRDALSSLRSELFEDTSAPIIGNPNGKTVVVEFSDYNCPFCKRMAPIVHRAVESNADLKVILMEFPILGPASTYASRAALAAKRQGKYSEFHWGLILEKGQLSEAVVDKVAASVGLDMDKLRRDMKAPEIDRQIARNLELGTLLGIDGTPAFIAGEALARGAISEEQFHALVQSVASSTQ